MSLSGMLGLRGLGGGGEAPKKMSAFPCPSEDQMFCPPEGQHRTSTTSVRGHRIRLTEGFQMICASCQEALNSKSKMLAISSRAGSINGRVGGWCWGGAARVCPTSDRMRHDLQTTLAHHLRVSSSHLRPDAIVGLHEALWAFSPCLAPCDESGMAKVSLRSWGRWPYGR